MMKDDLLIEGQNIPVIYPETLPGSTLFDGRMEPYGLWSQEGWGGSRSSRFMTDGQNVYQVRLRSGLASIGHWKMPA
jgi:hypothetical protein